MISADFIAATAFALPQVIARVNSNTTRPPDTNPKVRCPVSAMHTDPAKYARRPGSFLNFSRG